MQKIFKLLFDCFYKFKKGGVGYAKYKGVQVEKDCWILTSSFGSEPWMISIGNKITLTSGVRLLNHDGASFMTKGKKTLV